MRKKLILLLASLALACDAQLISSKDGTQAELDATQQAALVSLQQRTGAPVNLELNVRGGISVIEMQEGFPLAGLVGSPQAVAEQFVAQNRGLFRLSESDLFDFQATNIDADENSKQVILQRFVDGIPVYQGAISIHLTPSNSVYRALGGDAYHVEVPKNTLRLSPKDALLAAGSAFGVALNPQQNTSEPLRTTFLDSKLHDAIVEPRVFQLEDGSSRFAYQTLLSWTDENNQLQYELTLVDAETGELLFNRSLVESFRGKVFLQDPGNTDNREIVSFDGDPVASPAGWVGTNRKTSGNNVFAATDLNANNSFGDNEVQPTADANGDFFFNWDPNQSDTNFKSAAAVNAFFLVNDFHDRTYKLGFTESSGNFQSDNFGKGGKGNDRVIVDVQDGSGTNNANFATPPDGNPPRMQMFLWTANGGLTEDGDFDSSIVYHENGHGISNRLVGGGNTGCLFGTQSGGMGEGWGDFLAATFRNDPVVGGYSVGNTTRGIRNAPMSNSPFTYGNIKNGSMTEVHDAGEIWAATLWSIRDVVGADVIEQLVVTGMKLTPCNPTMLQARNAILQADVNLFGGANKCVIWQKFADRKMGVNAESPSHNSTSSIVLSTAIPAECNGAPAPSPNPSPNPGPGTNTQTFSASNLPLAIPDNNQTGVSASLTVPANSGSIQSLKLDLDITHTFRGDLEVTLVNSNGDQVVLTNQQGGDADNIKVSGFDLTSAFQGKAASGTWTLRVRDLQFKDNGTLNLFKLTFTTTGGQSQTSFQGSNNTAAAIPDGNTTGILSPISVNASGLQVQTIQVKVNISHPFRGDLLVRLVAPNGETRTVIGTPDNDSGDNIVGTFNVTGFTIGANASGTWNLRVADHFAQDIGTLNSWSLGINTNAP